MALQKILRDGLSKVLSHGKATEAEAGVDLSSLDAVHIIKGVGTAVLSCLLGTSGGVFSSYPFGIAFLAASNRFVPYTYIGLLTSSLFVRGYSVATAVVYTVIAMLRYAVCRLLDEAAAKPPAHGGKLTLLERIRSVSREGTKSAMFDENVLIRCAVSCFAAFVFGLYRLIAGGFLYYDLFGLLAGFLICPLLTLVLSGMFTRSEQLSRFSELSAAVLMFITVYAMRDITVLGFSLAFAGAFFVTMWAASQIGSLRGCAAGLFAGLACGGINVVGASGTLEIAYSVGAAPCIMATAGLIAGALWKFSRVAAVTCASIIGMTLGLVVDGYTILPRLLPDIFGAVVIFMPLSHFGILPRIPIFVRDEHGGTDEDMLIIEKKQNDTAARMNSLSEAFSHLADTLYSLSDRMRRPGVVDLKQVCDRVFDSYCSKCSMAQHCLERDCTTTLDAQSKVTAVLYKNGRVEIADVPPFLRERCFNITAIIDELNRSVAKLIERLYKNDKTEAFALDYEAMSKLLAEQISRNDAEYAVDAEMTAALKKSLKYMNIGASHVICYGSRKKQIFIGGVDIARMRMGGEEIRQAVENTVGTRLSAPRFNIEDDTVTMTLSSRRRYGVETAKASSIKESESANGDTTAMFENKEDYSYALICDGMGSGREAAITSKLCAVFIERMLAGGNGKAVTLEMLNGFIRTRGSECSATVDLAEIDLITGEACFIKSGAAPSFILRNGNLYKLQSKTVPIGIMHELDAEQIKFELQSGDVIIMLSDGVAQSLEDGIWLANLLTYEWEDDLNVMAEKILDNAVFANSRSDDMTVALVRVSETEE